MSCLVVVIVLAMPINGCYATVIAMSTCHKKDIAVLRVQNISKSENCYFVAMLSYDLLVI